LGSASSAAAAAAVLNNRINMAAVRRIMIRRPYGFDWAELILVGFKDDTRFAQSFQDNASHGPISLAAI
jgi:hypothetical protein